MFAVEDRELKERKRGESIGSDRLTVNLKGGRKERKSSEMRLLRDYVHPLTHIVRSVHILVTNRPQPSQPISPSVRPSIRQPSIHSASRATYHAFGAKAVCRLSSLPPSLAGSHGPRTHGNEAKEGTNERVCSAYNGALSNSEINRREVTVDR